MFRLSLQRFLTFACLSWLLSLCFAIADDEGLRRGEAIYRIACAKCHGDAGQGVQDLYPDPLAGDATIGELTELIADTMPEEEPETCVEEDAASVAEYIHHAFYSQAAQVRNRPPRIVLARLTGEQLRQSLADLYGRFDNAPRMIDEHGLKGTYFDGAGWKNEKKRIERDDPVLDLDFGHDGPGEGINSKEFYIHWAGSLTAEQTGRYELIVRSTCSFTMYFGNHQRELINNHVQSEGKTEFRHTLNLTAGHGYPIKIDFFQRKRKTEQPPAQISLSWIPPGGIEEIIPTQNLVNQWLPATFALQAKLPPDDRSYGYDRGTAINRQWDESTTAAAIEFSQIANDELWPKYKRKHKDDSDENRARLKGFLGELVETAFRGPLNEETRKRYIDRQLEATEDDGEAIKRVVLIALKSPRFLYPAMGGERSPSQRAANRLSLVLFDSLPSDDWLRRRVDKNELQKPEQIAAAARQMVDDYRARAKTRSMLYQWFNLSHLGEITKDSDAFPGFDQTIVSDLRQSFDAFLSDVVWSESSDFRQLFQADWTYTTDRLHQFFGDAWKPLDEKGARLRRSVGDEKLRMGAVSHPLLMSGLSYHSATSPIHRGVFLYRHVLGRTLRPPGEAFTPLSPELHPDLTTRERVELQTSPASCRICHEKINSLGFTLENFDTVGRFRTLDREKPVNSVGSYVTRSGERVSFAGPHELANFLSTSDDCQRAFVDAVFEYFVKQPTAAYGAETLDRLTDQFKNSGFNIRELIVAVAVIAASEPDLHDHKGT